MNTYLPALNTVFSEGFICLFPFIQWYYAAEFFEFYLCEKCLTDFLRIT